MFNRIQAEFLTETPNLKHTGNEGFWYVMDNVLFQDDDGSIYIVPRWFVTDLYTIPDWLAWAVGDSAEREPMPAILHDFGCAYHGLLKVNLTYEQLCLSGFIKVHLCKETQKYITICEDIPAEHLEFVEVSKGEINDMLGRALESIKTIDKFEKAKIRAGVAFNFGWYWSKEEFILEDLYKYKEICL